MFTEERIGISVTVDRIGIRVYSRTGRDKCLQ